MVAPKMKFCEKKESPWWRPEAVESGGTVTLKGARRTRISEPAYRRNQP